MARSMVFKFGRKAQITLFIILGIVILFAMIFVVSLTSHIARSQLSQEQEEVITALFAKEGLRVFVEGCLENSVREGIVLIGKQGRIWDDQPGGTKHFVDRKTGITIGRDRIAYGLTSEVYLHHPEAYPCNDDTVPWPFCDSPYEFPRTDVGFGVLHLKSSIVTTDLERYLAEKTKQCVQQFVQDKINPGATVVEGTMDLNLVLLDDGASVAVRYPFKVSIGGERLFQLASFDFFYPTRFKQLLDVGVLKPLENDYKFVDFAYSAETLRNPTFHYYCILDGDISVCEQSLLSERWQELGGILRSEKLPNGDTLFSIEVSESIIIDSPEPYTFQFIRQNRPPALDYINREQCLKELEGDYDYLIIKGDDNFGLIPIPLSAHDPDEDEKIDFVVDPNIGASIDGSVLNLPEDIQPGRYSFGVKAIDSSELEDSQTVRLLVDRPLTLDLSFFTYDDFFPSEYNGKTVVSAEDPVTMTIILPQESFSSVETVSLTYSDGTTKKVIRRLPLNSPPPQLNFPPFLFQWKYFFPFFDKPFCCGNSFPFNPELEIQAMKNNQNHIAPIFSTPTINGKIRLSYGSNYCGALDDEKIVEKKVVVTQCIPHQDQKHPYAFPYHKYEFGVKADGSTDFSQYIPGSENDNSKSFNPFQATHSCCIGNLNNPGSWEVQPAGRDCFVNPTRDCYNTPKFIVEEEYAVCDGVRGNVCGSDKEYRYPNNELRCGKNDGSNPSCEAIPLACEGQKAFGYVQDPNKGEKGWCSGAMGCQNFCSTDVVYIPASADSLPVPNLNDVNIAQLANENHLMDLSSVFSCGCNDYSEGFPCDGNFNGKFAGRCNLRSLACEGDS